jgi:hypothetical protein
VKPNLKALGIKYGRDVQKIMAALQTMPDDRRNEIAKAVAAGQTVEVAGKTLSPDELLVAGREKEGFASAEENGAVVIVSAELTPELVREGLARSCTRIRTYGRRRVRDRGPIGRTSGVRRSRQWWRAQGTCVRTLSVEVVVGLVPAGRRWVGRSRGGR